MVNINKLLELLDAIYPEEECFLTFDAEKPWQLLVATILSARCTDNVVNATTPILFGKYATARALADADAAEVMEIIRPIGFYRVKAANIIASMRLLADTYGGKIPAHIDILTKFPGVGRKTANLVLGHVYGIPGIVVDTHVARVSRRLGLTAAKDPAKIERDLGAVIPESRWIRLNIQLISHGRAVCTARGPKCGACPLAGVCSQLT